jgi:hypothetical protein
VNQTLLQALCNMTSLNGADWTKLTSLAPRAEERAGSHSCLISGIFLSGPILCVASALSACGASESSDSEPKADTRANVIGRVLVRQNIC